MLCIMESIIFTLFNATHSQYAYKASFWDLLMFITFMVNAGDCPLELGQLLKHRPAEGHWLFLKYGHKFRRHDRIRHYLTYLVSVWKKWKTLVVISRSNG